MHAIRVDMYSSKIHFFGPPGENFSRAIKLPGGSARYDLPDSKMLMLWLRANLLSRDWGQDATENNSNPGIDLTQALNVG